MSVCILCAGFFTYFDSFRSVHVWCKWYYFILFKDFCPFWCCLQLSMPTAPPTLFPFSHMTFKPVMDSFRLEALVPTPSFSQLPLPPLFLCTQRPHLPEPVSAAIRFRCGPAGSLSRKASSQFCLPPTYFSHCQEFILFFIPLKTTMCHLRCF